MNSDRDQPPIVAPPGVVPAGLDRRRPWKRMLAGVLALIGLGFVLPMSVSSIRAQHVLNTAPICTAGRVTRDCRQLVQVTVTGSHVFSRRDGGLAIDTSELGEIDVGSFPILLRTGDLLTVEVWRGAAVRVEVAGGTVDTLAAPSNDGLGWLMLVVVTSLVAHFTLRSLARRRLWNRLGRHPHLSAETRLIGAIGLVLLLVLATGVVLLAAGVVAGAAVIGLYVALLVYGLFVPQYSTRLIIRAIDTEAIDTEATGAALPRQSVRRVARPVPGDPDHR